MALTPITRHFGAGLVKLAMPYWGKPRVAAMLQAMLNRVQEIENAGFAVMDRYTLEGADTARLDVLGRVVGQPRITSDDEFYRATLRAKIRTNRSRSLVVDLVEVSQLIANTPTARVGVEHYAPATCTVTLTTTITDSMQKAFALLMPHARAAGVQLHLYRPHSSAPLTLASAVSGGGTSLASAVGGGGNPLYSAYQL